MAVLTMIAPPFSPDNRHIREHWVIVGAGILGLWAARQLILRGGAVTIIEKSQAGHGASGGFLGALMPYMPDMWNAKKQMQFEALCGLEAAIEALEADTGMDCGFYRCGRVMPMVTQRARDNALVSTHGSNRFWQGRYEMTLNEGHSNQWLSAELTRYGTIHDNFSARINPRKYIAALKAYVVPRATLIENETVTGLEPEAGRVILQSGAAINADKIIIANGWEAYALLQPFMGAMNNNMPIGRGVKGQAVLVEYAHDDIMPILYHDGTYVVPHADNQVAIGSTSVNNWPEQGDGTADSFDPDDMAFYDKAMHMVPGLRGAPVIERWAGVRPRNTIKGLGADQFFGVVAGQDNLIALIGGYKITLGIAHVALPLKI